jgi:hypothetical protein
LSPIDDDYSEASTSYKGLESSIGSEDPSDSFAKELQLAASLDQQAWDEFQHRKRAIENNEVVRASALDKKNGGAVLSSSSVRTSTNRNSGSRDTSSKRDSLLGSRNMSVDDQDGVEDDHRVEGIEADVDGNTSWVTAKSFPYGDEMPQDVASGGQNRGQNGNLNSPSRQWEPYSSALPPSPGAMVLEEKKDESNPAEFFARQLQNIEQDMGRYGGVTSRPRTSLTRSPSAADDNMSTTEILSEVEDITRYVQRYERRRDRRTRREMDLHDRLSVGGSSATGAMSIGMDGRVYNPHKKENNDHARGTMAIQSSSSSMSPPSEGGQLGHASSYSESEMSGGGGDGGGPHFYGPGKRQQEGNLSFISDDEDDSADELEKEDDASLRGRRLGISPFRASKPDEGYTTSETEKDDSTRTVTTSSRAARLSGTNLGIASGGAGARGMNGTSGDYRYGVGYGFGGSGNDLSKSTRSTSSRLTNLRANNAIIDETNSDVNPSFNAISELDAALPSQKGAPNDDSNNRNNNNRGGIKRINLKKPAYTKNNNTGTDTTSIPTTTTTTTGKINTQKRQNNNRFDRLRGLFEQKTTAQPEPIYPPGEHWQYGVSKK